MIKKLLFSLLLSLQALSQPLSGNYTVGGTSPDYATIALAVTALTTNGVSAPVTFNIRSGTYNSQSITVPSIPGASTVNTVTFKSETENALDVIFTATTFTFNQGASHIRIKYITFSGPTQKIKIDSAALTMSNIQVSHCVFTNTTALVTNSYINNNTYFNQTTQIAITSGNQIYVGNNTFNNVGGAVYNIGNLSNGLVIENNTINGAITPLVIDSANNCTITGNVYTGEIRYRTIYATLLKGNCVVSGNRFISSNIDNANASCRFTSSSTGTNTLSFVNNFVSIKRMVEISGFTTCNLYNNSFRSAEIYPLSLLSPYTSYNVLCNIFENPVSQSSISINIPPAMTTLNSNYNAFSNDQMVYSKHFGSDPVVTYSYAGWVALSGKDANSKIVGTVFANPTDLHIPDNVMLSNAGISLPGVTTDIDGEPRNASTPDIGADEFNLNPATVTDLGISIVAPTSCEIQPITVLVTNHSSFPVTSFDLECVINNNYGFTTHFDQLIGPGQSISVITPCAVTPNTWYEKYQVFVKNPNEQLDDNYQNNIALFTNLFQFGEFEIGVEATDCSPTRRLYVPHMQGATQLWSTGQTGKAIDVSATGTYSVTVTSITGCIVTKTININ